MATSAYLPPPEAWDERARTVRAKGMAAIVDTVMARWFTPDTVALAPEIVRPGARPLPRHRSARLRGLLPAPIRDMDLRARIGAIRRRP